VSRVLRYSLPRRRFDEVTAYGSQSASHCCTRISSCNLRRRRARLTFADSLLVCSTPNYSATG